MEVKNTNLNFEGRLYGHIGKHKTKPLLKQKFLMHHEIQYK